MALVLLALSAGFFPAWTAAAQNKPDASQQDKAKACNNMADKKGLTGNDRKNFMQSCLSKAADTQPISEMSQKDKMNACKNLADKKNLSGQDRRSFIKDCMNKANSK
ncbi:MAG: PsiF family protein [Bryobacteraceae bacterium]